GAECDPPRSVAHFHRANYFVLCGIDGEDGPASPGRHKHTLSIGRHHDAHRPDALARRFYGGDDLVRLRVHHRDRAAIFRCDVSARSVRRKRDPARPWWHVDLCDDFVGRRVDRRYAAIAFRCHVHFPAVRPHRDPFGFAADGYRGDNLPRRQIEHAGGAGILV